MPLILIAGTPGTGKTRIGLILARRLKYRFATLTWIILDNKLWTYYDASTMSFVVDEDKLNKYIYSKLQDSRLIIDTHWVEPFKKVINEIKHCIVLRTRPDILWERLEARGWPPAKIADNVEAELLGVIAREAYTSLPGLVYELDTTSKSTPEAAEEAIRAIQEGLTTSEPLDWTTMMPEHALTKLLDKLSRARAGEGKYTP